MELNFKTYTGTKTIKAVPMKKNRSRKAAWQVYNPCHPWRRRLPCGISRWLPLMVSNIGI